MRYRRKTSFYLNFQLFVLVFETFDGPYLCEFEGYGDSESTFTCLTFHDESIDILGFVERYREVAQIDINAALAAPRSTKDPYVLRAVRRGAILVVLTDR